MVDGCWRVMFPNQETRQYAVFNAGFRKNGTGWEVFPRYHPIGFESGRLVAGSLSWIAYLAPGVFVPNCITPDLCGNNTAGVEDLACLDNDRLAIGNKTIHTPDPVTHLANLMPIPVLFQIDHRGKAVQTGELDGQLKDRWCKGFTPLPPIRGDSFALIRPMYSDSEPKQSNPRIMACRIQGNNHSSNPLADVDETEVFLEPPETMGIGPSAPLVDTPYGYLFFYHLINWIDKEKGEREYLMYLLLLDRDNPLRIIAYSPDPILKQEDLPKSEEEWIRGAVYIRNAIYDPYGGRVMALASVADYANYWVWWKMAVLMASLKPVTRSIRQHKCCVSR